MPQQGITFAGAFIGLPGAYYADNVSAVPGPPPVTPPLVFLGYGWGPKPKTPVTFTNPQDLTAALRGGPATAYVPFLTVPSPQLNGAQQVTFIDVSSNTQSAAALLTSGGTVHTTLTSTLYGPPSNRLSVQVSNGSVSGGLAVSIVDNSPGGGLGQAYGDNLGLPFQLAYSGASSGGVTAVITSGSFTLTSPVSAESVSISTVSGAYSTVALLVEYLNGTSNYYASSYSASNGQLPASQLTPATGLTILAPSGGVLQYRNIYAHLYDIAFWVNQFASNLATAVIFSGAVDSTAGSPVTGAAVFFSGAAGVPPTNNDYALGLNAALSTPGWTVFADSNSLAVQALLAQHCITASSIPYGMWRRGFTGSSIGDSIATTITNSRYLDAIQMNYVYPGIYRVNTSTGVNQLYGGLYAAAAAAGMATGNPIATPLTNKALFATGVEGVNSGGPLTNSQLTQLQNNGIMAVYAPQNTGVPTILSDVTTWEADDNPENTSSQQVACRYWLAYSMVNALQPYVGQIASPVTEVATLNAAKRALDALIYTGGGSNGVLAAWDRTSLRLSYNGSTQTAAITVNVQLVGQNRYITIYASIMPLEFTIVSTG